MADPLIELMGKILTHIPEGIDNSLSILKGHLIAEEELYRAINSKVIVSKDIEKARLKFSQLMFVTKAHYFKQEDSWMWGALRMLNGIRNSLSHSLEPDNFGASLLEFIELVEANYQSKEGEPFEERLRYALAMLAAKVHSLARMT